MTRGKALALGIYIRVVCENSIAYIYEYNKDISKIRSIYCISYESVRPLIHNDCTLYVFTVFVVIFQRMPRHSFMLLHFLFSIYHLTYMHEKTNSLIFRPGPTQTRLHSHGRKLES